MRTVVGLDISYTSTGVAVFKDGVFQPEISYTYGTKPTDGSHIDRAEKTSQEVLKTLVQLRDAGLEPNAFIEDYAFARFSNREVMAELTGIVKHTLYQNAFSFTTLPIATIRKTVTGKGNADKTLVALSLLSKWGLLITQNDLADAAAVGITGDFVMQYREDNSVILRLPADVALALKGYLKNR